MTEADETTISVSREVVGLLQEAVAAGGYTSPSDAIRDALILRREQRSDDIFGYRPEEVDRLFDEGEASGPGRELDIDAVKREALRRANVSPAGA